MRPRSLAPLAVALGIALSSTAIVARADEPAPSPERIKAAAEEFDRGRRAYLAKEFENAAVHFENAFRDAPRAETLRLAIRARREAKQVARAATLAAVAEARYASDAATAQLAKETLESAAPTLQEYDVECASPCSVTADGRVVSQSDAAAHRIFLDPGPHDLGIGFSQGSVAKKVDAKKGAKETLAFAAPAAPPEPAPEPVRPRPAAPGDAPPAEPKPSSGKPLGPVVFFVTAGITVAAGAATVWSGIDTQNNPGTDTVRRECAGKDESCPAYKEGKSNELRTNVLLGVTGAAAIATAVIGVFFTDWGGGRRAAAGPRPTFAVAPNAAGAGLAGRF
jgi:hypothetical protein